MGLEPSCVAARLMLAALASSSIYVVSGCGEQVWRTSEGMAKLCAPPGALRPSVATIGDVTPTDRPTPAGDSLSMESKTNTIPLRLAY